MPQVGSRVLRPDTHQIDDFFRLFAAGEGLIAELCAARATVADIAQLRSLSDEIGALMATSQPDAAKGESYRVLNRRLHSEMRHTCRSRQLADLVESLGDRSDFYIALNLDRAHEEHVSIIEAIARGDEAGASAAIDEMMVCFMDDAVLEVGPDRSIGGPAIRA